MTFSEFRDKTAVEFLKFVITKIAVVLQNTLYYIYRLTSLQAQGRVMD